MLTSDDDETGPPRSPLVTAVDDAIRSAGIGARDVAAAELARTLAQELELGGDPVKVGPVLLRVLDALQLTPKSRAVAQKGGTVDAPAQPSRLDELRERRDRKSGAAPMDTAAP